MPSFEINPDLEIRQQAITADQVCIVVDDFLLDPEQVVAFAGIGF